jgi:acetoin utilization deacetylase AcuC-like enzyme
MKKVGFFYDDIFLLHATPSGHPESKERLIAIRDALASSGAAKQVVRVKPRKARQEDILAVHTDAYYSSISTFIGYYDADTYISRDSVEAALYAAGAVIDAVERCRRGELDRAFCAVRPPGHHAEADRAMGFCIFNNVAVGARFAQKMGYQKVFIVDFDVHHGNGTQHIFEEDDSVYYFSTHQFPHYPGTGRDTERGRGKGEGFTYNIPMHYGSGDKEYFTAYHDLLPGVMKNFGPDIVLISAGYDLHGRDPLAGLRVTNEGIRSIVRSILLCCRGIPQIFCLEGGYHLASLGESVLLTIEELLNCE